MQATVWRYIFLVFWLYLLPAALHAQTFRVSQYTTHEGLPIDNVYAAAQDSNGFIWFGTDFGIARFDGYRFTNYYKEDGLSGKAVTDMVYAGGDSILLFSYPGTIQSIHYNGKINTIVENAGISLQQIIRHNNSFFCYTRNGRQFGLLQNGAYKLFNADSMFNKKGLIIHAIVSLAENGVAFCSNQGLLVKNETVVTELLPATDVWAAVYTKDKKIIAVSNNIIVESDQHFNFHNLPFSFPNGFLVYHMAQDDAGTCWFRGLDKGVYRFEDNRLEEMSSRLGVQNKGINEFFNDAGGNFWFCTDGAGILLKKRSKFKNYETFDGLVNNKVLQLAKYKNDLFIGTSNGLCRMKEEKIFPVNIPSLAPGLKYVYKIFPVNAGTSGLCMYYVDKLKPNYAYPRNMITDVKTDGFNFKMFNTFFAWQQSENDYWIQLKDKAENNLYHYNEKTSHTDSFSLVKYKVKKMYAMIAFENMVWAGTNNGLIRFKDNEIKKTDSIGNDQLGQVFDFLIDKKKRLWMATEAGLFMYASGHFSALPKGSTMGSNYCRSITEDDEGKIWCATWDGIFVTDGINNTWYNTSEGLPSKTANTIFFDAATKLVYVGTDNGLSVFDKNKVNTTIWYNKVFINCSIANARNIPEASSLKPKQNDLEFYLSIPFFEGNTNISYEYRLDNTTWAVTKNPTLFISGIASGHHTFYARAKMNGQVFTKEDAVFSFTIGTPYYKSWWFILAAILLGQGIIIYIVTRLNKKTRERKLAEQLQQAEYASLKQQAFTSLMNPHFIFNALNSVQHYVNQQDRQNANKYLSDFASLVRRSFDTAQRSFVSLDEELETVRLYLQLEKMRFTDKFNYHIVLSKEVEDDEWMLPSMVLQPFLENAILHGLMPLNKAGELTIEAHVQDNALCITITDNGIGIEKSRILRAGKAHKSRGMQLIKERLQLLSKLSTTPIELSITDLNPGTENPGTKILLIVPQEVYDAFQKQSARG